MGAATRRITLEVRIDYWQLYIFDEASPGADLAGEAAQRALDDADESGRRVGTADGLIDVIAGVQWNFNAPMRVELWDHEPTDDDANWDHVVDIDLDAPSGHLVFQESGAGYDPTPCEVPPGNYRARVAGRGYGLSNPCGGGLDDYRVQLWARRDPAEPALRKAWPGFG